MATESGGTISGINELLRREPGRFGLYQAIRLIHNLQPRAMNASNESGSRMKLIGRDHSPDDEPMRFVGVSSLEFPNAQIAAINHRNGSGTASTEGAIELAVNCFGLYGAMGALPHHYTELIVERQRAKDFSLREFLDLFQHRLVSHLYRAWAKYRLPITVEETPPLVASPIENVLLSLAGISTRGMPSKDASTSRCAMAYIAHFSSRPRCAVALRQLLSDWLGLPVRVHQFQGQWLAIDQHQRTTLQIIRSPRNQLGGGVVLGQSVWSVESRFTAEIGPTHYARYCELLPEASQFREVWETVRLYAGIGLDFDIRPVLRKSEIPRCRLGLIEGQGHALGRNLWLGVRPHHQDFSQACFKLPDCSDN